MLLAYHHSCLATSLSMCQMFLLRAWTQVWAILVLAKSYLYVLSDHGFVFTTVMAVICCSVKTDRKIFSTLWIFMNMYMMSPTIHTFNTKYPYQNGLLCEGCYLLPQGYIQRKCAHLSVEMHVPLGFTLKFHYAWLWCNVVMNMDIEYTVCNNMSIQSFILRNAHTSWIFNEFLETHQFIQLFACNPIFIAKWSSLWRIFPNEMQSFIVHWNALSFGKYSQLKFVCNCDK